MEPLRAADRVGLLTSGSDAPGINAALRAAAKVGTELGLEVLGIEEGYKGLMEGRVRGLNLRALDEAARRGGTMLGTARSKLFSTAEGKKRAEEAILETRLSGLIVLGGGGALAGAQTLAGMRCHDGREFRVIGIPASVDNDVGCTALSIGVDTAMNTIVEACDRMADTAQSQKRIFIIELMGRHCGYLARAAGIAAAADAVLLPESSQDEERIIAQVQRTIEEAYMRQSGRRHVLFLKNEAVKMHVDRLKAAIDAHLGERFSDVETQVTVLGPIIHGGAPSAFDRMLANRLGSAAIRALSDGETQVMAGWAHPGEDPRRVPTRPSPYDPCVALWPLSAVLSEASKLRDDTPSPLLGHVEACA